MGIQDANQLSIRVRMSDNADPRAQRTRSKLVAAYQDLLAAAGNHPISVARVTGEAGVSRTSFYSHFADMDALAVAALRELFDVVTSDDAASRALHNVTARESSEQSLRDVIGFIALRRETYAHLLTRSEDFASALEDAVAESAVPALAAQSQLSADAGLTARFFAAGVMGVITWWLRGGGSWTAEELAHQLTAIIPSDFTTG